MVNKKPRIPHLQYPCKVLCSLFRDDLLLDLHKFSRLSPHDKETLDEYFAPVNTLSTKMEKHIKSVMRKTLNAVRSALNLTHTH